MLLDRVSLKNEAKGILRGARVSPYLFTLLFMGISLVLTAVSDFVSFDEDMVHNIYYSTGVDLSFLVLHRAFPAALVTFVSILVSLLSVLLNAGYYRYHLAVRRGEEVPYLGLFDGFSFAGKLILLALVQYIFIFLWTLLFIVPGFIAAYRYRFAVYNLCENPDMGRDGGYQHEQGPDCRLQVAAVRAGPELHRLAHTQRPDAEHPGHLAESLHRPD